MPLQQLNRKNNEGEAWEGSPFVRVIPLEIHRLSLLDTTFRRPHLLEVKRQDLGPLGESRQ